MRGRPNLRGRDAKAFNMRLSESLVKRVTESRGQNLGDFIHEMLEIEEKKMNRGTPPIHTPAIEIADDEYHRIPAGSYIG